MSIFLVVNISESNNSANTRQSHVISVHNARNFADLVGVAFNASFIFIVKTAHITIYIM